MSKASRESAPDVSGHGPAEDPGAQLAMFSPQDELAAMEATMRELMMQKGNGN